MKVPLPFEQVNKETKAHKYVARQVDIPLLGNVKISNIPQNEVGKLLVRFLSEPSDEALCSCISCYCSNLLAPYYHSHLGSKLFTFAVSSQTVLRETVIKVVSACKCRASPQFLVFQRNPV